MAGRGRRSRAARPALWRALSAAQIQDRPRDPRGQHNRCADQRPRDRAAVGGRPARRLRFSARRRAWHDPQQPEDLSAARDPGRLCRARGSARRRGGGGQTAPRLGRPRQSPPRPAQIRDRRARRGRGRASGSEEYLGKRLEPCRPLPPLSVPDHLGWHEQGDGKLYLGIPVASGRIVDGAGVPHPHRIARDRRPLSVAIRS